MTETFHVRKASVDFIKTHLSVTHISVLLLGLNCDVWVHVCVITGEMGSFSTMKTQLCVQEQTHSHAFEKKKYKKLKDSEC